MKLTRRFLLETAELVDRHPKYGVAEKVVYNVFSSRPKNTTPEDVLLKVSVLNSLYATAIYDLMAIVEHITHIDDLDIMLAEGNMKAVELIRKGHGVVTRKSSRERDFYSFATKYCSFHNLSAYPVYDNLVADFLYEHNHENIWVPRLKKLELKDYLIYNELIDRVLGAFDLPKRNYKHLDKALWICAKYYYRNRKYVQDDWINKEMRILLQALKEDC